MPEEIFLNSYPTISLVISTIGSNLKTLISSLEDMDLTEADEIVMIIQKKAGFEEIIKRMDEKIMVIIDSGTGISRSRNLGISHASSEYIWFLDDDIILNHQAINKVKAEISSSGADVYTVRTEILHSHKPYKSYPSKLLLNRFDMIRVSSVEIIVSRKLLGEKQIQFNESLGLGSPYPSCEENIFLLDLFDKGAVVKHIPQFIQTHPPKDRNKLFIRPEILFAKGIFCHRFGGWVGTLLLLRWWFRSLRFGAGIDSFSIFRGYNSAINYLKVY